MWFHCHFFKNTLVGRVKKNETDFGFVGPVGYCSQFTCLKAVFIFMSKLGNTWSKESSSSMGLQRKFGF